MELYNNPKNIFVGGFIGSPKMNFIKSKILGKSSNKTEVDILDLGKINIPKTSENSNEGDFVQIGIRPEHLLVNKDGDANWESKVLVVEKGKRYHTEDFPKTNWNLKKYFWMPRLFLYGIQCITLLKNIFVLHGTGVGGGSLVYANTLLVPPDDSFNNNSNTLLYSNGMNENNLFINNSYIYNSNAINDVISYGYQNQFIHNSQIKNCISLSNSILLNNGGSFILNNNTFDNNTVNINSGIIYFKKSN